MKINEDTILVTGKKFVEERHLKFSEAASPELVCKKSVLENFTKFTGKQVFCNFIKRL